MTSTVNESLLRRMFEVYGQLNDVVIKDVKFNPVSATQLLKLHFEIREIYGSALHRILRSKKVMVLLPLLEKMMPE